MPVVTGRRSALVSQKGGSGKTTVTMQLAAGLAGRGYRIAVYDLDPQESALRWAESASADTPFPAGVLRLAGNADEMTRILQPAAQHVDFVLLDCPPSIEHPNTTAALDLCDLAVVPVVPSPTDLWSTRAIEKLILQRMERRRGRIVAAQRLCPERGARGLGVRARPCRRGRPGRSRSARIGRSRTIRCCSRPFRARSLSNTLLSNQRNDVASLMLRW